MFSETCSALAAAAAAKAKLLHSRPGAYVLASAMAGVLIALGSIVFLATGGYLTAAGWPGPKLVAGLVFSAALSLVVMAGSELFTGNNLTVGAGLLAGTVTGRQAAALWGVCWLGNLAGSWLMVALYRLSGLAAAADTAAWLDSVAAGKLAATPVQLVAKGILCNLCVCLAVWCCTKMKSESGKLIMIVWCILIFMVSGFEHSVANMSILGLALVNGAAGITPAAYLNNLLWVTLGNWLGGFGLVALPYWLMGKPSRG